MAIYIIQGLALNMARIRSNRVCFTVNNYEEEDTTKFIEYVESNQKVKYAICGEEVGKQGTFHLQGYIHLDMDPQKGGIRFWKDELPFGKKAHFESARGTDLQNKTYCSKDGIYYEFGEASDSHEGIWERLFAAAKVDMDETFKISAELAIRHYHQLSAINAKYSVSKPKNCIKELRPWQKEVLEKLDGQDDRKILFVVDYRGGKGKTSLTKYLLANHEAWSCSGNFFATL